MLMLLVKLSQIEPIFRIILSAENWCKQSTRYRHKCAETNMHYYLNNQSFKSIFGYKIAIAVKTDFFWNLRFLTS